MVNKVQKYVFVGDCNSINLEIIYKSFSYLKNKLEYILIGDIDDLKNYLNLINSKIRVNEIYNPLSFKEYKKNYFNFFNVKKKNKKKYENLLYQIKISNSLANKTKNDLVTMPINKNLFKKEMHFIGMTEYLAKINKTNTLMLMLGNNFSVIPFTTHINPKNIHKKIKQRAISNFLNLILINIRNKTYNLNFKKLIFICYNPHCGENGTIGNEDNLIEKVLKRFPKIQGPYAADSSFTNFKKETLFITTYHDQGLIPFKSLNNKGVNLTLGLNYKRLSPAHGTAIDIKSKNLANIDSYIQCMLI